MNNLPTENSPGNNGESMSEGIGDASRQKTESPASSIRFSMIAMTTLLAVMLYLDRVCLGILSDKVKPLLGDTLQSQDIYFAYLSSAFFWSYALFQLPAGWLGDRFGPRLLLAFFLFMWSLCTAFMGLANGFLLLFFLRLGCGLFEAGAYPLAAGIVNTWMPTANRGIGSGIVSIGGRLGGAIAPMLTVWLAGLTIFTWRWPFFVYGIVGMLGAIPFWWWYRNHPSEHPKVNSEELALITNGKEIKKNEPVGMPPFGKFIRSKALWADSLIQFISNFAWVFIISLFPDYLEQVFNTPKETRANYQSLTLYTGIVGMLLGGWLSDLAFKKYGPRWGRALPVIIARFCVCLAYIGCLFANDAITITIMLCIVAWATDLGMAPMWAWAQDTGGRFVGAVVGWANMWGNLGAAIAPMLFAAIRYSTANPLTGWKLVFILCAGLQIIGAVLAYFLDSSKQIDSDK